MSWKKIFFLCIVGTLSCLQVAYGAKKNGPKGKGAPSCEGKDLQVDNDPILTTLLELAQSNFQAPRNDAGKKFGEEFYSKISPKYNGNVKRLLKDLRNFISNENVNWQGLLNRFNVTTQLDILMFQVYLKAQIDKLEKAQLEAQIDKK